MSDKRRDDEASESESEKCLGKAATGNENI